MLYFILVILCDEININKLLTFKLSLKHHVNVISIGKETYQILNSLLTCLLHLSISLHCCSLLTTPADINLEGKSALDLDIFHYFFTIHSIFNYLVMFLFSNFHSTCLIWVWSKWVFPKNIFKFYVLIMAFVFSILFYYQVGPYQSTIHMQNFVGSYLSRSALVVYIFDRCIDCDLICFSQYWWIVDINQHNFTDSAHFGCYIIYFICIGNVTYF